MRLGGELAFILSDIDYSSKQELLDILRKKRDELQEYPKEDRIKIKPYLAVAIQQAFYASEYELLRFKRLSNNLRGENGSKNENKGSSKGTE